MNLTTILPSPTVVLLLKWTGLLVLAWGAHGLLRRRDARWRLILWRSMLCFGLLLPLFQYIELPGLKIPLSTGSVAHANTSSQAAIVGTESQAPKVNLEPAPARMTTTVPIAERTGTFALWAEPAFRVISWKEIIAAIWMCGCALGIARLAWLQLTLNRLRNRAVRPTAGIEQLAAQVRTGLKIKREVQIRTTDAIFSPFVCDLLRPTIMLPQKLVQSLTPTELGAVLNHEMAHIRQNDLVWCVAWQWLRALCWFHPLVWRVPAVHNFACEQEADRVASAQMAERDSYVQLLAQLALKVLVLPAVETRLTVNGSSEIAKRLIWLGQSRMAPWNWHYSVAAFSLSLLLFFAVAGCNTATNSPKETSLAKVEFKKVLVVVQDEDGKPIEGATISPDGFRVKGTHDADAYSWNRTLFGEPLAAITDSNGKARVRYPIMGIPEEKERTGKLIFSVSHPGFVTVRPQEFSVDEPEPAIRLPRSIHLEVSAYFGAQRQAVSELVPTINQEMALVKDWRKKDDGTYVFDKLSAGGHLLQLMGRLPSGEIVFSDTVAFMAQTGSNYTFNVEMKPGIRLEGRLDDKVPRPVKNGRVVIAIRPPEFPAWTNYEDVDVLMKTYNDVRFWKSYRPISEDGTFVFESVPPGGLDVIVHGDGFVSKNGAMFYSFKESAGPDIGMPQAFALNPPVTKIEISTEPSATLEFIAKTRDGKPIEGASVYVNPNVLRINGIFGQLERSAESPFREIPALPDIHYWAKTDKNGVAIVPNLPSSARGLEVDHPNYQVPLQEPEGWRDRHVRASYNAGETNRLTMVLEPKGTDYIGTAR